MVKSTRPLTLDEARAKALETLDKTGEPGVLVIVEKRTREFEFGWVFSAESRIYLETGDRRHQIPGIGPIVVERDTGKVTFLPSGPPDVMIDKFLKDREKLKNT